MTSTTPYHCDRLDEASWLCAIESLYRQTQHRPFCQMRPKVACLSIHALLLFQASTASKNPVLTDALAMDCEGVGVGPKGSKNVAARVSLVNEHGECVYDVYIKPSQPVTDYRTWLTGIDKKHLDSGIEKTEV